MSDLPLQEFARIADSAEAGEDTAAHFTWQSTSCTDLGRVRHVNEDAFLDSTDQRLWVVADGMGGHSRGDYASGAVVKYLREFARQGSILANLRDLEDRLQAANERCRTAFRNKRPGTTVVTMLAHGNCCFFLWAGDSRVYRLREQALTQLTQDHTVSRQKYARGELSEEEAANHPSAHVLTRAVGIREKVELDLAYAEVQPNDRYLLCSDGLYNPLQPGDLEATLAAGTAEEACQGLVKLANDRGGPDNITAIVVEVSELN